MTTLTMPASARKFRQPGDYDPQFKFLTDESGAKTGQVEFYAAIFGNVDLVGDVCMPGCFSKSLQEWRDSGDPIPVVFSHDWSNAEAIVGWADPAQCVEDGKGLLIRANFLKHDYAQLVLSQMEQRIVREASFAYDTVSEGRITSGPAKGANALKELRILEVGPCLKGANPLAGDPVMKSLILDMPGAGRVTADGVKTVFEGSAEERVLFVEQAVTKSVPAPSDGAWVTVDGTWDDHAVYTIHEADGKSVRHFDVEYTLDGEVVTLGKVRPVEVDVEVKADSGEDRSNELFDLSDKQHTTIAVGIVFGAEDERDGTPKATWSYRGGTVGGDLSDSERAHVVSRVRAAADKFGIDVASGKGTEKDLADATSETGAGAATGGDGRSPIVPPDYEDDKAPYKSATKAGARHSAADLAALQAAHDHLHAMGAVCSPDDVEAKESSVTTDDDDVTVKDDGDDEARAAREAFTKSETELLTQADFYATIGDVEYELKTLEKLADLRKGFKPGKDEESDDEEAKDIEPTEDDDEAAKGFKPGKDENADDEEEKDLDAEAVDGVDNDGDGSGPNEAEDEEKPFEAQKAVTSDDAEADTLLPNGEKGFKPGKDAAPDDCGDGCCSGDSCDCKDCVKCGAAEYKDLDAEAVDGVDTDGDGSGPNEPEEEAEAFQAQKSASANSDDGGAGNAKDDEPEGAKSDERGVEDIQTRAKADLADIEAFLASAE